MRGLLFLKPRIMLSPFRVFPAPAMPAEHQAESDPMVTSRRRWGSWAIRDMAWKGPLRDFISSASRGGGGTGHQKKDDSFAPQDVKAKPAFKRKITVKRRNSPLHQRPKVRNTNELYSNLWVHMNTDLQILQNTQQLLPMINLGSTRYAPPPLPCLTNSL